MTPKNEVGEMSAAEKLRRIDELVPYPGECPQWGGPDWREMARQINAILQQPELTTPSVELKERAREFWELQKLESALAQARQQIADLKQELAEGEIVKRTFKCFCSGCGCQYEADMYQGPVSLTTRTRCCSMECVKAIEDRYYHQLLGKSEPRAGRDLEGT